MNDKASRRELLRTRILQKKEPSQQRNVCRPIPMPGDSALVAREILRQLGELQTQIRAISETVSRHLGSGLPPMVLPDWFIPKGDLVLYVPAESVFRALKDMLGGTVTNQAVRARTEAPAKMPHNQERQESEL